MPATVAGEMGETVIGSPHFHALYGIAVVLFIITFVSILITEFIVRRRKK
jgi:phosphate transport system permease protein